MARSGEAKPFWQFIDYAGTFQLTPTPKSIDLSTDIRREPLRWVLLQSHARFVTSTANATEICRLQINHSDVVLYWQRVGYWWRFSMGFPPPSALIKATLVASR